MDRKVLTQVCARSGAVRWPIDPPLQTNKIKTVVERGVGTVPETQRTKSGEQPPSQWLATETLELGAD